MTPSCRICGESYTCGHYAGHVALSAEHAAVLRHRRKNPHRQLRPLECRICDGVYFAGDYASHAAEEDHQAALKTGKVCRVCGAAYGGVSYAEHSLSPDHLVQLALNRREASRRVYDRRKAQVDALA